MNGNIFAYSSGMLDQAQINIGNRQLFFKFVKVVFTDKNIPTQRNITPPTKNKINLFFDFFVVLPIEYIFLITSFSNKFYLHSTSKRPLF